MSEFSLSLSFPRDYYLECAEQFEGSRIDCVDQEFSEFGGDAEDLAYELAYTRYALAREEVEIERLRSEVAELKQERDRLRDRVARFERLAKAQLEAHSMSAVDYAAMRELEMLVEEA